ncbi:MAG: glycosyltransferase family 4 protein [Actinobacteria bacterium]|nr:glycosyltransferase family 4 protein [Actinomycetota bacterium]
MRIAYLVHQYLPDHVGGTELYTHGLAVRAARAGHDVVVLTHREAASLDPAGLLPHRRVHEGIPVIEFRHTLGASPNIALFEYDNPLVGERVRRVLEEISPDLVHATHAMKLTTSALAACRSLGIPVLLSLTDFWFLCPRHTLLTWDGRLCRGPVDPRECLRCVKDLHGIRGRRDERRALRARPAAMRDAALAADRVIALSPFLRRMFVANGYDPERIEVLRHGIETSDLGTPEARRTDPRLTRLVVIGSLVPYKGAHVAVEALRGLPELTDARLTVYGEVGTGDYAHSLVRAARGDRRIRFAGTFDPDDMGRVLSEADYLLVPALWYENEPIVVKAAVHVGLPVIASRIGSLEDMVEEGVDGWTVAPGDVPAWREVLRRAVAERARWPRRPRPQPDMDEHFRAVEAIYRDLAVRRVEPPLHR